VKPFDEEIITRIFDYLVMEAHFSHKKTIVSSKVVIYRSLHFYRVGSTENFVKYAIFKLAIFFTL
jgi:hypothetical protein